MQKTKNKDAGDIGEKEVVKFVLCPNCTKKLMLLPHNFPMYDVQCTGCTFRAQVKTNNCKPKNIILGAGYDIYEKVLKAGFLSPSLIVLFRWNSKQGLRREIRFYPFVAKGNIQKYRLSNTARRANYRMFLYVELDKIPFMVLHQSCDPLNRSIEESKTHETKEKAKSNL